MFFVYVSFKPFFNDARGTSRIIDEKRALVISNNCMILFFGSTYRSSSSRVAYRDCYWGPYGLYELDAVRWKFTGSVPDFGKIVNLISRPLTLKLYNEFCPSLR